jgi:hypothetical protein
MHKQTRNAHQNVKKKDNFKAIYLEVTHKKIFNPEDKAAVYSQILICIYQTTQHDCTEDCNLLSYHCQHLKHQAMFLHFCFLLRIK